MEHIEMPEIKRESILIFPIELDSLLNEDSININIDMEFKPREKPKPSKPIEIKEISTKINNKNGGGELF